MKNVILLCLLLSVANSQVQWTKIEIKGGSPIPSARRDGALGYLAEQNVLVLFGGRGTGGIVGDTWVFNMTTKTWSKVSETLADDNTTIPEMRFSMVYGAWKESFYISTGEGSSGVFYNDVVHFNLTSKKWTKLDTKTSVRPEKRYGSGGGVHKDGDGLYVTHGFSAVRYSNTFKFDFNKNEWIEVFSGTNSYNPSYPHARCLHGSTMTGKNELVLFGGCLGGGESGGPCPAEDGWKFNAGTSEWTQLEECASPRQYSSMAMLPSSTKIRRAVLFGGVETSRSVLVTEEAPADELVVFDPDKNKWTTRKVEGAHPVKRQGTMMVTTDAGIIVFGGSQIGGSGSFLNDMWLLNGTADDVDKNEAGSKCGVMHFNLIMLHGIFMFIGWGVLLQGGAFVARYFRHKDPWWFKMHRALQMSGLLFAIGGFVCAVVSVPFAHFKFAHSVLGLDIMLIGLFQPINAFFRPHKREDGSRSKWRVIWEWYHKLLGRLGLLLALINISLGLFLAVVPQAAWIAWYVILVLFVALYVIMEVRLRLTRRSSGSSAIPLEQPPVATAVQS